MRTCAMRCNVGTCAFNQHFPVREERINGMNDNETSGTSETSEKNLGWYTAFYRYAEFLRVLTKGSINHKNLYALVGLNGRYVNNKNPRLRKRCAGGLSRLLHSTRYVDDFKESLQRNPSVFHDASHTLAQQLAGATELDVARLVEVLLDEGCKALRAGLVGETSQGRSDVNFSRLDSEIKLLSTWAREQTEIDASASLQTVLCSFFYFMACGHLEEEFAHALVDIRPTDMLFKPSPVQAPTSLRACMLRAADDNPASIENMWAIREDATFCIGRYVDCDAVETNGLISRRHCSIFQRNKQWFVRDEGSRFGTAVHRDGVHVWSSTDAPHTNVSDVNTTSAAGTNTTNVAITSKDAIVNHPDCFPLEFGDCLVLAGQVRYWFMSLQNVERLLIIE